MCRQLQRASQKRREVKLTINPAACDGFGYSAELLPELLSLDEWGFPILSENDVPVRLLTVAKQVVQSCPRRALVLLEANP